MDEIYSRSSLRDRILNDLRNIVKQIYHESVNNELSLENKTYVCLTLVKNLDEVLRHGLKQLHLGYWKPIKKIIHSETRQSVEKLKCYDGSESDGLMKGRAWIALSLKDDSFISYIQCLVALQSLDKFYEDWSILRSNDPCNHFLSILSGLENISFLFEIEYLNKPLTSCTFGVKAANEDKMRMALNFHGSKCSINLTASSTSLTSPVDSGVHTQDSTSDVEQLLYDKQLDIDFLNGNIPETVLLRKNTKDSKRHVSFHEDIIYKSPEKCRKLKWDSENLRYSWSGEQLDSSILNKVNFNEIKNQCPTSSTPVKILDINERGTPEGEETPSDGECLKQNNKNQKSLIVKRFLYSIRKQSKNKQLYKKYNNLATNLKKIKVDSNLVVEINNKISKELESKPQICLSKNEICLNEAIVKEMIRNQFLYKTYKLRDYVFIITNSNIYLINKNLETKRISFKNLAKIVIYPDSHVFKMYESDEECHIFVTGDAEVTNNVIGRLELSMRRNQFDHPEYIFLDHEDMSFVRKTLVDKLAIGKAEKLLYCGAVQVDKENNLTSSALPSSKRGFLMYKDLRAGDGWIPGDFSLKNGILYLFEDYTHFPKMAVNIATDCQSCNTTNNPDRPHTFQISLIERGLECYTELNHVSVKSVSKAKFRTPDSRLFSSIRQKVQKFLLLGSSKENSCILELAAANECELSEWLQMIIQASCGDACEEAHKEDLIEGTLWLTSESLIITNEIFSAESSIEILSHALLRDVAAFKLTESDKDHFIVIEFICMEACNTSGDWILYMNSRQELEKLRSLLQTLWNLNEKFPSIYLKEGSLVNHCRRSQESLNDNCWTQLFQ